ncbi:MAG: hypothetical protein FJ147_26840 [Deltaproteobacteria bacterium]|nr:hypothetical protein [Deltaproteobacteria bacterium]
MGRFTPVGGSPTDLTQVVLSDLIGPPTGGANLSKSGPDLFPPGQLVWSLGVNNNNSNVPLDNFEVIDELPIPDGMATPPRSGPFDVVNVTSGRWPDGSAFGYNIVADLAYSTDGTSYTTFATGVTASANTTYSPPTLPANTTHIRWSFRNTNTGAPLNLPATQVPRGFSFTTAPQIRQTVAGAPFGTVARNCLMATFVAGPTPGTAGPTCDDINLEEQTPAIRLLKDRFGTSGGQQPGDEIQLRLRFQHISGDTTGNIVTPTIADLLPPALEFVSWDTYTGPSGQSQPNLQVLPNFNATGRTLLRWTWSASAPAGSQQLNGSPGVANAENFEPSIAAGSMPNIVFTVRIRAGTVAQTLVNTAAIFDNGPRFTCGTNGTDTSDLGNDSNSNELVCTDPANIVIPS